MKLEKKAKKYIILLCNYVYTEVSILFKFLHKNYCSRARCYTCDNVGNGSFTCAMASNIKSFEEQFWSGIDLANFYEANKENLNHPLGMIFKAVWEEWLASSSLQSSAGAKPDIKERMLNVAHVQKVKIMRTCENYMDALAMFIKIAPFLGLMGTVIGMIDI